MNHYEVQDMRPNEAILFTTITTILSFALVGTFGYVGTISSFILFDILFACAKLVPFASLYLAHQSKINKAASKLFKWVKNKFR